MLLSKLLKRKDILDYSISSLEYNSKFVNSKSLFFAIKGFKDNGNNYIEECLEKGCRNYITNDINAYNKYNTIKGINIIYVKNINRCMAVISKRFYKNISKKMYIIGITGTNGKTTTSTLIYKYLRHFNIGATLIGTNGVFINEDYYEEKNTSPNVIDLYKYLYKSKQKNIKYVIMEVSSHAIALDRVYGVKFKIKCLTNITIDHLDFHKNIENYKKTKLNWLKNDKNCQFTIKNCLSRKINYEACTLIYKNRYKSQNYDEFYINTKEMSINGTVFEIISQKYGSFGEYKTNLIGQFNMQNIVLFLSVIKCINKFDIYKLKNFLNNKIFIDGRVNIYEEKERYFIIDFAHTPDGVNNIFQLFKRFNKNIISVCGCGGDRDKTKRAVMGSILFENSKIAIFTSDNPRSEEPSTIIDEMCTYVDVNKVYKIISRFEAIKKAYEISDKGDIILILGKGNESKQYFKKEVIDISDLEILCKVIGE